MRKLFTFFVAAALGGSISTYAANGDNFTYQGIKYTVLDEAAGTVETMESTSSNGYDIANGEYEGDAVVPAQVVYNGKTYTVIGIGEGSFYWDSDLTGITFPETLQYIGESAFYKTGITSVEIPESVTSIESSAFGYCTDLTTITLPASITSLPTQAFSMCPIEALYCYAVTPPTLADNAFSDKNSSWMTDAVLYVPAGSVDAYLNSGQYQWPYYFANIQPMDGEGGNGGNGGNEGGDTTAGESFEYQGIMYTILDVTAKTVETYAGDGMFDYANGEYTGHAVIPSQVEYKGDTYTVVGIGEYSFYWDPDLTGITFPETLQYIGESAFYRTGITSVEIPESVTSIEPSAFGYCTELSTITLPASITSLPGYVFNMCPIEALYCYAVTPPTLADNAFSDKNSSWMTEAVLYVPAGSVDAYMNSGQYQWPYYFANIQPMESEGQEEVNVTINLTSLTEEGDLAGYVNVAYEETATENEGEAEFVSNSFNSTFAVPTVITITPAEGYVATVSTTQASEAVILTAPADGSSVWTVDILSGAPEVIFLNVEISNLETLGVLGIDADCGYKVYNLQGVRVLESKDASGLYRLPAGIYIINGKKVMIGR